MEVIVQRTYMSCWVMYAIMFEGSLHDSRQSLKLGLALSQDAEYGNGAPKKILNT